MMPIFRVINKTELAVAEWRHYSMKAVRKLNKATDSFKKHNGNGFKGKINNQKMWLTYCQGKHD